MDAKKILVNGESLDVILRHYYAIPAIVREVKKRNGDFSEWDKERAKKVDEVLDVKIEIE